MNSEDGAQKWVVMRGPNFQRLLLPVEGGGDGTASPLEFLPILSMTEALPGNSVDFVLQIFKGQLCARHCPNCSFKKIQD